MNYELYRRPDSEISVSIPERRYDLAGELLAAAVEQSIHTDRAVDEVLPETAHNAGRQIGTASASLERVLDDYGFEPAADGGGGWLLANCPFHQLARQHTELICGLNLELLRGVADGAATISTRWS